MLQITGDTYELRDQLKAMGCRWDADARCWTAPDEGARAQGQLLADGEPVRKWRAYAESLAWAPGVFTKTVWEAGLRACSLGLTMGQAMDEIGGRVMAAGGSLPSGWLERNVGRAYEHGTPPDREAGARSTGSNVHPVQGSHLHLPPVAKPVFVEKKLAEFVGTWAQVIDTAWLADRSPVDPAGLAADDFLRALYVPGERVVVLDVFASQGQWLWSHAEGFVSSRIDYAKWDGNDAQRTGAPFLRQGHAFTGTGPRGIWYLCNPVDGDWVRMPKDDDLGRGKWSRRSEPSVTSWRYFALESDDADPRQWVAAMAQLPLRIAAIYTSGVGPAAPGRAPSTSVHFLVRVDAESKEEFDSWRDQAKRTMIPLGADKQCMSAVRLTRLPSCLREGKDDKLTEEYVKWPKAARQKLLYLDPEAGDVPLVEREALRDSFGPWERFTESLVAAPRGPENPFFDAVDEESSLAMLREALAQWPGERAARCRELLRRWLA